MSETDKLAWLQTLIRAPATRTMHDSMLSTGNDKTPAPAIQADPLQFGLKPPIGFSACVAAARRHPKATDHQW
jgi:hypothetical protein